LGTDQTIAYSRVKTDSAVVIHFGALAAAVLKELPSTGFLFPKISQMHEKHRAKQFHRRCKLLGIKGVSLYSYRYAGAERARPEWGIGTVRPRSHGAQF
jgi:hypothetical protein